MDRGCLRVHKHLKARRGVAFAKTEAGHQMKWFYRLFTWWHGQTLNTALYTLLFGKFVGEDEFANRYYRSRKIDKALGFERRWVTYAGESEGTGTPPGWYGRSH